MLKTVWFNSQGINRVDMSINDLNTAIVRNEPELTTVAANNAQRLLQDIRNAWVDVTDIQANSVS